MGPELKICVVTVYIFHFVGIYVKTHWFPMETPALKYHLDNKPHEQVLQTSRLVDYRAQPFATQEKAVNNTKNHL